MSNKPAKQFRLGVVTAAIFENEHEDRTFYNITFSNADEVQSAMGRKHSLRGSLNGALARLQVPDAFVCTRCVANALRPNSSPKPAGGALRRCEARGIPLLSELRALALPKGRCLRAAKRGPSTTNSSREVLAWAWCGRPPRATLNARYSSAWILTLTCPFWVEDDFR